MQKDFDARALLSGVLDFTTCQRSDGTYYGTGGTCRKGVETTLPDTDTVKKEMYDPQVKRLKALRVSNSESRALDASAVDDFNAVLADELGFDKKKVKEAYGEVKVETERIREEMRNSTLDPNEVDTYKKNHMIVGDVMKAQVITVGMEYGGDAEGQQLSKFMAMEAVARKQGLDHIPSEVYMAGNLQEGSGVRAFLETGRIPDTGSTPGLRSSFFMSQGMLASAVSGEYASPMAMELKGSGFASLEARAVPAPGTNPRHWGYDKQPWVKNNPAMMKELGTRSATNEYDKQRFKRVSDTIVKAAEGNNNLKTVIVAAGKGGNAAIGDQIARDLSNKGYGVREFKYTYSSQHNDYRTGRIIDLGKGRYAYDIGGSLSAQGNTHKGVAAEFQKQQATMVAEQRAGTFKSSKVTDRTGGTRATPQPSQSSTTAAPRTRSSQRTTQTNNKATTPPTPPKRKGSGLTKEQQRAAIINLMKGQGRDQGDINAALKNAGL